jgi:protein transport protein SEC61 subunit gamma and related proteins
VSILKSLKSDKGDRSIVDRAWELQYSIEARQKRIGRGKYGRVLKMARKPTDEEFAKTSKITGAGILIVGGLGFVVWLLAKHVAPWIGEIFGWI